MIHIRKTFLLEKDKKGYILTGLTRVAKPGSRLVRF